MDDRRKRQFQFSGGYWLVAFAALLLLQSALLKGMGPKSVGYDELLKVLREGKLAKVEVRQSEIVAELKADGEKAGPHIVASRLPGMDESLLVKELQERTAR